MLSPLFPRRRGNPTPSPEREEAPKSFAITTLTIIIFELAWYQVLLSPCDKRNRHLARRAPHAHEPRQRGSSQKRRPRRSVRGGRGRRWRSCLAPHNVCDLAPSKHDAGGATALTERQVGGNRPDGNHYRDMAGKLRELARHCRFAGARRELLQVATNYDGRADHFDSRANRSR
jgi:hypothetical protein